MDSPCWVGLEGQNFASSILDTQDLSTIRGGSLLLRDLVGAAGEALERHFPRKVQPATMGGSFGVWKVDAPSAVVQTAIPLLHAELTARHAQHLGFGLVALVDDGQGYSRQRRRLRAALQRNRLTETRLPYPALDDLAEGEIAGVCPIDLVRPIASRTGRPVAPDRIVHTSRSVFDRRQFGIDRKQRLLREETLDEQLGDAAKAALARDLRPFAMQIGSISERTADRERLKSNLQDKICVISLDGNSFGDMQDKALSADDRIERQSQFDADLTQMRRSLISKVFDTIIALGCEGRPSAEEAELRTTLRDPIGPEGPVVRFELLLWGGDEIMFIVPGRVGWQVLEEIGAFEFSMPLGRLAAQPAVDVEETDERPVKFSVGAVFCHHSAPIARVKKLADDLGAHIKALRRDPAGNGIDGKERTHFLIEVLESFDHVGMDLDLHFAKRTPKWPKRDFAEATRKSMRVMNCSELRALRIAAEALSQGKGGAISRGRLRQAAFALHRAAAPGAEFAGDNWANYVRNVRAELKGDARQAAVETFGVSDKSQIGADEPLSEALGQARFFTLLEEYWDYLTPAATEESVP